MNIARPSLLLAPLSSVLLVACAVTPAERAPSGSSGGLSAEQHARLVAFQEGLVQEELTGSNVALVFQGGEVAYHHVVNSGREGDRDITEETLFPIWSMSKPITIVAMMTLHEQGLFEWDDPVSRYLPCFAELTVRGEDGVRPATQPLLVEHLMTHRSGWSYYAFPGPATYRDPHPNQTRFDDLQDFVEVAARTPLAFEPGSAYLYGINQAILGRLVEVLSGKPFAQYLEETLFEPLGMTRTSFVLDAERRAVFQPLFISSGALSGFTTLLDELTYSPESRAHFGGEGLVSCPADYARFCELLLGRGEFRGERIFSEASLDAMTTIHSKAIEARSAPGMDMGYSVFVLTDPGAEGTGAPAGIFGWSGYHNTHFWIDPASDLFGLFMTRAREFSFVIPTRMRSAIYGE